MSYFNAARQAGICKEGVCEQDDYIYDAPHLSSGVSCSAPETSYCAIEHAAHSRKKDDAGVSHPVPDAWESRWLAIREAA